MDPNRQDASGEQRSEKRTGLESLLSRTGFWILLFTLALLFLGAAYWNLTVSRQRNTAPPAASILETRPAGAAVGTERAPTRTSMPDAAGAPTQATNPAASAASPEPTRAPALKWYSEGIDLNPKAGIFSSLALTREGVPYAAYFDDANDDLKLASYQEGAWRVKSEAASSDESDGWYPSLAVDPKGSLHLSYFSQSRQQIIYGRKSGADGWKYEVAAREVSALDTSLAVGADQTPHIVYFDEAANQVRYLVKGADGWAASTIGEGDKEGAYYPIALDPKGQVHVVFKAKTGELLYSSLVGGDWVSERVDETPGVGDYPSLAFDRSSRPRISCYDPVHQDLKYAYRDGKKWRSVTVDGEGQVGKFTSLAIDSQGEAHISYYDEANTALKYASGQGEHWKISLVNDEGNVGKYNALVLDQDQPRISYYDESSRVLMMAWAGVGPDRPAQRRLSAFHRSGQTFLTWAERSDLSNENYRIYRSDAPINAKNLHQAALLAQVGEGSSVFWVNYHESDGVWSPRLSETLILEKDGAPVGKGTGVFVWTVSPEEMKGSGRGAGYYAVTLLESGSDKEQYQEGFTTGPVQETVADPQPVEITASPGIRAHAEKGGHYYIQYMDFRRWNPTYHAPNPTNLYYGFDPNDPRFKNDLAYAYDYSVFEPTPSLCGGKVPDSIPIMVFLHGARGNRYGTPDNYPYPYCAYGVYPVDETETWYFGFARQHDYRSASAFSPEDVIENYTEQRILRMIYTLIQNPPGPKVDPQRVYLFGHSMGGTGSLAFAQRYPNVFAGIYSGQPVTQFYATEGYKESWPHNLATKWGPQDLNLPIAIDAPADWSAPLQKYNGVGVFEWENLRAAFSPKDRLKRIRDDMVPLGIDHGTVDDSVQFPTQGQPLYPLLNGSTQAWAGAVTDATHQWSVFGWPMANFGKVDDVPFWNFGVIRDETVPGLSFLSGNRTQPPESPTTYNQTILWSASWNAWDGAPVDQPNEWQMSFCAIQAGAQKCGESRPLKVDITPRRLQKFVVTPGKEYRWENRRTVDNELIDSGTVTADENGLLTVKQVKVFPDGNRLRFFAP